MDDGYISPVRTEYLTNCPLCNTKLIDGADPLMQLMACPNPGCAVEVVNPVVSIYSCTICGRDTELFSGVDDLPYCMKHLPGRVIIDKKRDSK